jgi:hypothetical protein
MCPFVEGERNEDKPAGGQQGVHVFGQWLLWNTCLLQDLIGGRLAPQLTHQKQTHKFKDTPCCSAEMK